MALLVRIRVVAARHLPIMDAPTQSADPYVIISHHSKTISRTPIARKTLNPQWNHEFRYELSDPSELQDHVLDFKVWDHDVVSSDHIIGSVLIVVDNSRFEGWLPILDSLKGIRGELFVSISLEELGGDINPWKEDSQSVRIFACTDLRLFPGATIGESVEELLVDEDPEHTWMDNFRSSRTSNEQRQQIFYKLSGKLRRKMGKKARDQGYNSIIAFQEHFDLEEENGIIIRGFGTLANIPLQVGKNNQLEVVINPSQNPASPQTNPQLGSGSASSTQREGAFVNITGENTSQVSDSPTNRSPRLQSTYLQQNNPGLGFHSPKNEPSWRRAEVRLCTLRQFEKNRIKRIGGLITAKSVKLCARLEKNRKQLAKIHDSWWNEIRDEMKSHARTLHCNFVLGYDEKMYIHRDICILWATGTAAVLRPQPKRKKRHCKLLHIPYSENPFLKQETVRECEVCDRETIPEILLATIESPEEVVTRGEEILIEARVIRSKKNKTKEEELAKYVSNLLPFIEYDLHKQLIHKLKLYGMNIAWNYTNNYAISQDAIICTCSVQAARSIALPKPTPLEFHRVRKTQEQEDDQMILVQQYLEKISLRNIRKLDRASPSIPILESNSDSDSSTDSEEDHFRGDDPSVIEIRDHADDDQMASLLVSSFRDVHVSSFFSQPPSECKSLLSMLQHLIITKRYRLEASADKLNQYLTALINDINSELAYRVNPFTPCLLAGYRNKIDLFDREIQIQTSATVILLGDNDTPMVASKQDADSDDSTDVDSTVDEEFGELRPPLLHEDFKSSYRKFYEHVMQNYNLHSTQSPASNKEVKGGGDERMDPSYGGISDQEEIFSMDHDLRKQSSLLPLSSASGGVVESSDVYSHSSSSTAETETLHSPRIHITNLFYIPGYQIRKMHRRVYIHFLRENDSISDPAHFLEDLYSQAKNLIRYHVIGSGGNAVIGFQIQEHSVLLNTARRQAYGLISCSGDIAEIVPVNSREVGLANDILTFINLGEE